MNADGSMVGWTVRDLTYVPEPRSRAIVDDVSLDVVLRRITILLGPNGAGKTTLLRLLLGMLPPTQGTIAFRARPMAEWDRRALAQIIGVVAQGESDPLFTVRDMVAMGRYPHMGPWQRERLKDRAAIDSAMQRCDVAQFSDRWMSTLSGGEQQRVRLARALAQEPSLLVLDEPTASLDICHEMTTFELLRRFRVEGATVVLVTHNLNLAARYADDLVLMHRGRVLARGAPNDVLTRETIEDAYEWPVEIVPHRDGAPQVVPLSQGRPR